MYIKNRRMMDNERYQMIYDTLSAKRDCAKENYKFARKNGDQEKENRYFEQFLTLDGILLIMSDDNELLQYAHIWDVINELPDDLKDE